jgi:hypothetical protein
MLPAQLTGARSLAASGATRDLFLRLLLSVLGLVIALRIAG